MPLRVRVQAVEAAVLAAHMQYGLDYVIFRTVRTCRRRRLRRRRRHVNGPDRVFL